MTDEQKEIFNRSPYEYRTMSRKSNKRKKSKRVRGKKLVTKITAMLQRKHKH